MPRQMAGFLFHVRPASSQPGNVETMNDNRCRVPESIREHDITLCCHPRSGVLCIPSSARAGKLCSEDSGLTTKTYHRYFANAQ
jgi:hypothetical protein